MLLWMLAAWAGNPIDDKLDAAESAAPAEAAAIYAEVVSEKLKKRQRIRADTAMLALQMASYAKATKAYDASQNAEAIAMMDVVFALDEAAGEASLLADASQRSQAHYVAAVAAYSGQDMERAKAEFEWLHEHDFDRPSIYGNLYLIDEDPKWLLTGLERFPEDDLLTGMRVDQLSRESDPSPALPLLAALIERSPDDPIFYIQLSAVHDGLYNRTRHGKFEDLDAAQKHLAESKAAVDKALELDPKNFAALYSLGAWHVNRSVEATNATNELSIRDPKVKEFEAIAKTHRDAAWDAFVKAEPMAPDDLGILDGLKMLAIQRDDLDAFQAVKARMEAVRAGTPIEGSLFEETP